MKGIAKAAEVELPKPDGYMNHEDAHYIGTSADWQVSGDKRDSQDIGFYTEQTVRALLAATYHSGVVDKTSNTQELPVDKSTFLQGPNKSTAPSVPKGCWCTTCRPITWSDTRFVVCPDCGNKRCPRAHNHRLDCTNSNAPGQPGSSWEHVKPSPQPPNEQAC